MGSIRIHNTANKCPHSHKILWHPHLLDGLVEDESLGGGVYYPQPVPADVEQAPDGLPLTAFHQLQRLLAHLHPSGLEHLSRSFL